MVRTKYCELDRSREQTDQIVKIFYDPERSTSISPVGRSSCPEDQCVAYAVLGTVAYLGMSVFFAYLALRAK
jgi:ribosomal protein L2